VILHYLEDLPVRDVAEILHCQESTAKVHLTGAAAGSKSCSPRR
jgi:DNA-directed RNA polymerase specialized sigma24 family protein